MKSCRLLPTNPVGSTFAPGRLYSSKSSQKIAPGAQAPVGKSPAFPSVVVPPSGLLCVPPAPPVVPAEPVVPPVPAAPDVPAEPVMPAVPVVAPAAPAAPVVPAAPVSPACPTAPATPIEPAVPVECGV